MTAILVLQMYSILLKELCLLENKSMISALGILARKNRKTLLSGQEVIEGMIIIMSLKKIWDASPMQEISLTNGT